MNKYSMLLDVKENNIELSHFPTKMQALVFRMWEMIPAKKLAMVMRTTEENVTKMARDLGLPPQKYLDNWITKGYITIIKNCWHILPYEQLLELLEWDESKLAFTLREDDFLGTKLGAFKPECDKVIYRELTEDEKLETEKIKVIVSEAINKVSNINMLAPFDFYSKKYETIIAGCPNISEYEVVLTEEWTIDNQVQEAEFFVEMFRQEMEAQWDIPIRKGAGEKSIIIRYVLKNVSEEYHEIEIKDQNIIISVSTAIGVLRGLTYLEDLAKTAGGPWYKKESYKRTPQFETRFIYSYSGLYGNIFDEDVELSYPDELLYQYAKLGVNGIWVQGVLYQLHEFCYEPSFSLGWQDRRERLKALVEKAKRYGIKVYIYLNEPRSMPDSFFKKYPQLRGHVDQKFFKGMVALCTSKVEVLEYLKNAVKDICTYVPELGGFFTITSSENLTNCYSRVLDKATNCPVCANRKPEDIIAEINNTIAEAAKEVNPEIKIIAWSWGWIGRNMDLKETESCIVKTSRDVTIMCTSEEAMEYTIAGCKGRVRDYTMSMIGPGERSQDVWTAAKRSGHKTGAKVQVNCTWECSTVPYIPVQGNVQKHMEHLVEQDVQNILLSWTLGGYPSDNLKIVSSFFFDNNQNTDIYKVLYGDYSEVIRRASQMFSEAFREFPFSVKTLYKGPQNGGPSNLLYLNATGLDATMTCYSYDDLEHWFDREIYPFDVFVKQWGLMCKKWKEGLDLLKDIPLCDFVDVAGACYDIFKSSLNQILFVNARNQNDRGKMLKILSSEKECALNLYKIMLRNPCIGYEASNHYFYNRTQLLEKIVNCCYLEHVLED